MVNWLFSQWQGNNLLLIFVIILSVFAGYLIKEILGGRDYVVFGIKFLANRLEMNDDDPKWSKDQLKEVQAYNYHINEVAMRSIEYVDKNM